MNAIASELENMLLDSYEVPQVEEERQRFQIRDEAMADWALRKIARARAEFAEADQVADEQIQRIEDWRASKKRDLEHAEEFFGGLLRAYYLPQHEADPKRKKTFRLPSGQVQFRAQQPEYKRDDGALLRWLKVNMLDGYIERVEKPKWGELKKILQPHGEHMIDPQSGEVVIGIQVIERPTAIKIVTATEAEGEV